MEFSFLAEPLPESAPFPWGIPLSEDASASPISQNEEDDPEREAPPEIGANKFGSAGGGSVTDFGVGDFEAALRDFPRPLHKGKPLEGAMRHLLAEGLADLPLPAHGNTWERWRALAAVGALDLPLAKIYEGHTDALAILAELKADAAPGLWSVWAAEPPDAKVTFRETANGGVLSGRKAWCSGAAFVDCAVVSAWTEGGEPLLAQVKLRQPGVTIETDRWKAVGMAASESVSVIFRETPATAVGAPGDYVQRPGFWQGGAGIAAVWYGGATAVAEKLATSPRIAHDPHAAAHLGAIDFALRSARALLREAAAWIDAHPQADACAAALRVRACVEAAAQEVLLRTGRALGPGLLCGDAIHAQRCADLPVFLRQSHAEQDLQALGELAAREWEDWL